MPKEITLFFFCQEKTLEDVRRAVLRNDGNTTSAEILSLIESASFSDASEEWETAMNE